MKKLTYAFLAAIILGFTASVSTLNAANVTGAQSVTTTSSHHGKVTKASHKSKKHHKKKHHKKSKA